MDRELKRATPRLKAAIKVNDFDVITEELKKANFNDFIAIHYSIKSNLEELKEIKEDDQDLNAIYKNVKIIYLISLSILTSGNKTRSKKESRIIYKYDKESKRKVKQRIKENNQIKDMLGLINHSLKLEEEKPNDTKFNNLINKAQKLEVQIDVLNILLEDKTAHIKKISNNDNVIDELEEQKEKLKEQLKQTNKELEYY